MCDLPPSKRRSWHNNHEVRDINRSKEAQQIRLCNTNNNNNNNNNNKTPYTQQTLMLRIPLQPPGTNHTTKSTPNLESAHTRQFQGHDAPWTPRRRVSPRHTAGVRGRTAFPIEILALHRHVAAPSQLRRASSLETIDSGSPDGVIGGNGHRYRRMAKRDCQGVRRHG